ncbi:hypothetical protein QA612_01830 [Evansella sp. AB-P1]|uniref:hypothetical protein n=1 Tax=Evansella sp. AB-P1 TaxID=3037653 RepID=UPI00241FD4DC|nr:hypothetical protein [Evansella sp. AB-P1]MDG5786213.1 hypothetical protein [Evansella sp. AB-P1]
MKYSLFLLGLITTIIFGGLFLRRLLIDGEFYIFEFIVGIIGIIILLIGLFKKGSMKPENSFLK